MSKLSFLIPALCLLMVGCGSGDGKKFYFSFTPSQKFSELASLHKNSLKLNLNIKKQNVDLYKKDFLLSAQQEIKDSIQNFSETQISIFASVNIVEGSDVVPLLIAKKENITLDLTNNDEINNFSIQFMHSEYLLTGDQDKDTFLNFLEIALDSDLKNNSTKPADIYSAEISKVLNFQNLIDLFDKKTELKTPKIIQNDRKVKLALICDEKLILGETLACQIDLQRENDSDKVKLTLIDEPEGMIIDYKSGGVIKWTPTKTGTITFKLQAIIDLSTEKILASKTISVIEGSETDKPVFKSECSTTAIQYEKYTCNLTIENSKGLEDDFEITLVTAPADMTLDKEKKSISWIPQETGKQKVVIKATNKTATSTDYSFEITVGE